MKIFKKIIAAVAAAAIAITALPMSAFANDWKTNAKTIQRDKEYSFTLPDNTSDTVNYKFEMKFPGYLVLDISSTADDTRFMVRTDGWSYPLIRYHSIKGDAFYCNSFSYLKWDSNAKKGIATFSGELTKGTHYLEFWRGGNFGSGKVKFTARFYSTSSSLGNYKNASSGKTYKSDLSIVGDEQVYRFDVAKSGTMKVKLAADYENSEDVQATLYKDSDDNDVEISNMKLISGSYCQTYDTYATIGDETTAELSYKVTKGTYYLRLFKNKTNTGTISMTATYPQGSSNEGKISCLSLDLKKGGTLQLGAVMAVDGNVTWTSSKTSVASVSSTGKVTAKGTGTAVITAKSGKNSVKVQIKVS